MWVMGYGWMAGFVDTCVLVGVDSRLRHKICKRAAARCRDPGAQKGFYAYGD